MTKGNVDPIDPAQITAVQAARILKSLDDDSEDSLFIACTRLGDHEKGLQLLTFKEFKKAFPNRRIDLEDEDPVEKWKIYVEAAQGWKHIRVGKEHRMMEINGPVMIINTLSDEDVAYFDKLDAYYRKNANVHVLGV